MLNGAKTYIAGILAMLSGLVMMGEVALSLISGEPPKGSFTEGMALFTGGLATVGIGHKIDKASEGKSAGG